MTLQVNCNARACTASQRKLTRIPVVQPIADPSDQSVVQPADDLPDQPVAQLAADLVDQSVVQPADDPSDQSVEHPVVGLSDQSAVHPAADSIDHPVVQPTTDLVEQPSIQTEEWGSKYSQLVSSLAHGVEMRGVRAVAPKDGGYGHWVVVPLR